MPAYLVQKDGAVGGQTFVGGHDSIVVFAADVADARSMAKGHYGGATGNWDNSVVTELAVGTDLSDSRWNLRVEVQGHTRSIGYTAQGGVSGIATVAINAGGTGYSTNDILTHDQGTGTASRAATFRVTSQTAGVIDGIELVDPGEYSVNSGLTAEGVTGGSGTGATFDITYTTHGVLNYLSEMVGLLLTDVDIAGAAVDMGAGPPPLLTVSSVADALGDMTLLCELRYGDDAVTEFVGTITHEGVAAAVLSAEFTAAPVIPVVHAALRSE